MGEYSKGEFYRNEPVARFLKKLPMDIIYTYGIHSWADNSCWMWRTDKAWIPSEINCICKANINLGILARLGFERVDSFDSLVFEHHSPIDNERFALSITLATEDQWKFLASVGSKILPLHMVIANYIIEFIIGNDSGSYLFNRIYQPPFEEYAMLAVRVAHSNSCIPKIIRQYPGITQEVITDFVKGTIKDYDSYKNVYNFLLGEV